MRIGLSCIVVLFLHSSAAAWNSTGHKATAYVAWQAMTPETRERVAAVLQRHPRYEQDLLRDMPADFADPHLYAFMMAATWPDMIRSPRHPMMRTHHKGQWHYINFAFVPPGETVDVLADQLEAWEPGAEPANILQAMAKCIADLDSDDACLLYTSPSPRDRG